MIPMTIGANAAIPSDQFNVLIEWPSAAGSLDCLAFQLTAAGRVRNDHDMIFYNQPRDPSGAVELRESGSSFSRFSFDTSLVEVTVERIVICVTTEDPSIALRAFQGMQLTLDAGGERLRFEPDLTLAEETALKFAELYRRSGGWKLRAVAQGYNDGLAKLATSFGVDVAGESSGISREQQPEPDATKSTASASKRPGLADAYRAGGAKLREIAQGVNDGVVRLATTRGKSTVGRETGDEPAIPPVFEIPDFGSSEATQPLRGNRVAKPREKPANVTRLNEANTFHLWSSGGSNVGETIEARMEWTSRQGGTDGRPRELILELGVYYELLDGRKGVLQRPDAVRLPFESGSLDIGERSQVEGAGHQMIARVPASAEFRSLTFYAFSKGSPSWAAAAVSLSLTGFENRPVQVAFERGQEGCGTVALLTLERSADGLKLERVMMFADDQRSLDAELGWSLHWRKR